MKKLQTQFLTLLALMLMGTGAAYAQTDYGFYVGETKVTSSNASNILGNGQFSYNASTKTLYVTDANLSNTGSLGTGINNREVDGLIIKLVGTCTFYTRMNCISSYKSFSITGTGTLNASSSSGNGIGLYSENTAATCTINGPKVNFSVSSGYAVYDYYGTSALSVKGADTRVTLNSASNRQTVNNLKNLTVSDGLKIVYPQNAKFSSSMKTVALDGTACKGTVAIGITYGLYIGETMVTSYNYQNVNGDGMFVYRPNTKTLDVRSGAFTNTGTIGNGIDNREIDGLTIHLSGTPIDITARNYAIYSEKSFSITGPGTLNATSNSGSGLMLGGSTAKTCTIGKDANGQTPTLYLKGSTNGIRDYNNNTTLNMNGAGTVITLLPGTGYAAVENLKNMTFDNGLDIVNPTGPSVGFYPSLKSISANGSTAYKGKVEIAYDYGLFIGETKVSKINYTDILGNGQFKYDPNTKTLNVYNANLDNQGPFGNGIDNRDVDGLTINLSGTSTIKARNDAITSCTNFSIKGSGTLNAIGQYGPGISFWGDDSKTCTIDGPKLNICSEGSYGLRDYSCNTTLIVEGTTTNVVLEEKSGNLATVYNLNSLSMGSGIDISEPTWASFDYNLRSIKDYHTSEPYKGKIQIGVSYRLYIAGKTVSIMNASGITGEGITGDVIYDASTKSLTLRDATITTGDNFNPIQNQIDGLNIIVEGTNNIDCTGHGHQLLCIDADTKISGSGTLNLKTANRNYCARVFHGSTLTIEGPKVNGSTAIEALAFYPGNGESLVIKGYRTQVTLNPGEGRAAIKDLTNFTLDSDLHIIEPLGATFSSSLKSITLDGSTPYMGKVEIRDDFGIFVAETSVTIDNYNDVLGDGAFKYDHTTHTLTVTNANLDNQGSLGVGISNRDVDSLNIKLVGNNTFNTRMASIDSYHSFSIIGSGTLNATSKEYALYLMADSITCTIDGPTATFSGARWGLKTNKSGTTLNVVGADPASALSSGSQGVVTFAGLNDNAVAISGLGHLTLGSGLQILTPQGGVFSESEQTVIANSKTAKLVVIGKADTVKGDVNNDGKVDVADIATILSVMAGTETGDAKVSAADVNGDHKVDVADIASVLTVMAGL